MITFHLSADVKEDRRVVLTLPPETPLGDAELVVTVTSRPAVLKHAGKVRRHFGAVNSGDSRSGDNERIDADLARVYENAPDEAH